MPRTFRFKILPAIDQVCVHFGISKAELVRRAALPADVFDDPARGLSEAHFYRLWRALFEQNDDPDLALKVGRNFARAVTVPALLAYCASRNVREGIARLAVFKPLVAPVRLLSRDTEAGFEIEVALNAGREATHGMAVFEVVYLTEMIRNSVLAGVDPLLVSIPQGSQASAGVRQMLNCPVHDDPSIRMLFRSADADLPLISANQELLERVQSDLEAKMEQQDDALRTSERVKAALTELLPAGHATIEAVCERLIITRRSLQRKLKVEGKSFQELLSETREEMSLQYLRSGEMSVEEISYLLAYRDPNSFYRAFHGWTGMTPAEARRAVLQ